MRRSRLFPGSPRPIVGIAVVLALLVTSVLLGPTVEAQQQQDALDQDTRALKASDLQAE